MTNRKHTTTHKKSLVDFSRIEKFHPYKTFLFFALIGSTLLFMSFSFLYFFTVTRTGSPENFVLPKSFAVSTVLLLLSSFSINTVSMSFKNDSFTGLKSGLIFTISFGLLFCITQFLGWKEMITKGFFLQENVGVAYLYIISGIHFAHVLGGIIYLGFTTGQVFYVSQDLARSLMFFSDDYHHTKLQLIQIYWHFIDLLWVFLYFMFLFTF